MNERNLIAASTATLQGALAGVDKQYSRASELLKTDILEGRSDQAKARLDVLLTLANCKRTVSTATEMLSNGNTRPLYLCCSWFLRECLESLTRCDKESMLYTTGLELGSVRTLDRQLGFQYKEQTGVYVAAESQSNRNTLAKLDSAGQRLLAWFHSHPGRGASATLPSDIDNDHQGDLEQGGYPAIGAIFSRDGYVRFFSSEKEFDVIILGKNMEHIHEKLFKLTNL